MAIDNGDNSSSVQVTFNCLTILVNTALNPNTPTGSGGGSPSVSLAE